MTRESGATGTDWFGGQKSSKTKRTAVWEEHCCGQQWRHLASMIATTGMFFRMVFTLLLSLSPLCELFGDFDIASLFSVQDNGTLPADTVILVCTHASTTVQRWNSCVQWVGIYASVQYSRMDRIEELPMPPGATIHWTVCFESTAHTLLVPLPPNSPSVCFARPRRRRKQRKSPP